MTPAEAMAAQPPVRDEAIWFDLPTSAREWVVPGQRCSFRLPAVLCADYELEAHEQLLEWDALVGQLLRESLFGDGDPVRLRETAVAVAAVAERLAMALGAVR